MPSVVAPARHAFLPRVVQLLGGHALRCWLRLCFAARVRRSHRLPGHPVVFAANHRSFLDPPFIGMWSRDPVAYFARANLWHNPLFRLMLGIFYGIPVERENPGLSSMKGAVQRLRSGISVVVFPEGTRTRDGRLARLRDGPALFARRAGVPLVPVYLHRSDAAWPRGALFPRLCGPRLEIRFGSPLVPPAELPPRAQDAWLTRHLQAWMELQERKLRGPRTSPRRP